MSVHKRMRLVTDTTERSVLAPDPTKFGDDPVIKGNDHRSTIQHCGNCDRVLILNVPDSSIVNIVIKCPACGSFNETTPALH